MEKIKGIMIDPKSRNVKWVEYGGNWADINELLGTNDTDYRSIGGNMVVIFNENMYDEATDKTPCFTINGFDKMAFPCAALIIAYDEVGDMMKPNTTAKEVRENIRFFKTSFEVLVYHLFMMAEKMGVSEK
jgi:hypothetical protein